MPIVIKSSYIALFELRDYNAPSTEVASSHIAMAITTAKLESLKTFYETPISATLLAWKVHKKFMEVSPTSLTFHHASLDA